ncbi:hypothetical protein ETSB_0497 [cyanobacterium endosymbiont of Epithemia turgida isolate EtSB Lake Yunoko]|nr:hypothetical protein ETSB_0497 [cyanobacterium endosymbiont of Epithemia turgida isolate EtSB Lake Yunoko]
MKHRDDSRSILKLWKNIVTVNKSILQKGLLFIDPFIQREPASLDD